MDNFQISYLVSNCFPLKHNFCGVFAADCFPRLPDNCFALVNTSISTSSGSHWILICNYRKKQYTLLIHLGKQWIATILYTLDCCSSDSKKKLFNSSYYSLIRTQTQNRVDSFFYILLLLFSHIAIRMYTT